jgi:predicted amidohydrolase YtcJ
MMRILYNARIYTLDPSKPLVSAIAINRDRVIALGDDFDILSDFGEGNNRLGHPELRDAGGLAVIPGLTDAHIHLETFAMNLIKVDCESPTRESCLERVAERARALAPGEWILGHGWNQNDWNGGFGNSIELDAAAPHNPVYLTARSLHAAWANTQALRNAGLSTHTPDPPNGLLGRDENGNLTGILFESAMDLVVQAIPTPSVETVAEAINQAQRQLWMLGLTGVHDFDRRRCFTALQMLHRRHELRLRVIKSIPLEDLDQAIAVGLRTGFGDDYLRIGAVKIFADGALGPHTAAMLQPYQGEPENRGILILDAEDLYEHGRKAVENGLCLAVHAIGDRANHEVLDAYDHLNEYERQSGIHMRHRIEHVQLIHTDDANRLGKMGVIASMQPIHATSDMLMADRFWGTRATLSYAWRTQLNHGAKLAFGSDAPVESPNPFWGIHAAVTRRRADGSPGPQGWYPDQRLNILEAIQGYTVGAAYAAGLEDRLGRLAPGYLADLLILDADPFTISPDELRSVQPLATMVGGEWVWEE